MWDWKNSSTAKLGGCWRSRAVLLDDFTVGRAELGACCPKTLLPPGASAGAKPRAGQSLQHLMLCTFWMMPKAGELMGEFSLGVFCGNEEKNHQ